MLLLEDHRAVGDPAENVIMKTGYIMKIFRKKSVATGFIVFLLVGMVACLYFAYKYINRFAVDVGLAPVHASLLEENTIAYRATNWGFTEVFVREIVVLSVYDENGAPVSAGGSSYSASSAELLGDALPQQKAVQDNQVVYVSEYTLDAFKGLIKIPGNQEGNTYLSQYDLKVDAGRNVRVDVILQGRTKPEDDWETAGSMSAFLGDDTLAVRLLEENAQVPALTHTVSYQWRITGNKAVVLGLGDISEKNIIIPSRIMLSWVENVPKNDPLNGKEYPVEVESICFFETDIETVYFQDGVKIEKNAMGKDSKELQRGLFENCTNLVAVENIPDTVTDMSYTFKGCTKLTQPPELPENVENMTGCFQNCTGLQKAPKLPARYVIYKDCFRGCSSLTGTVEIPKEVVSFQILFPNIKDMFAGCKKLDGIVIPCCNRGDIATLMPKGIDVSYQLAHQKKGACPGCAHITDTRKVDGMTVYFDDIPQVFVEDLLMILDTQVPDKLKEYCPKLTFTQSLAKYNSAYKKDIWAGFASFPSNKAYVRVRFPGALGEHDTESTVISGMLRSYKSTIIHELAHTYDYRYSAVPKHSDGKQWKTLCQQEGDIFIPELVEYYRKDEYRREMFARAAAWYVTAEDYIMKNCPGMYGYIDKLFGQAA